MSRPVIMVGRFQPFHNGHLNALLAAAELGDVYIGIGSANIRPSPKNPFTVEDRMWMIQSSVPFGLPLSPFLTFNDYPGEDEYWCKILRQNMAWSDDWMLFSSEVHRFDFFRQHFPDREVVLHTHYATDDIHATDIRELFFREEPDMDRIKTMVPAGTFDFLQDYFSKRHERWQLAVKGTYL